MQKNIQTIAGNLAEDAVIRSVSPTRDALNLRVITNSIEFDTMGNEIQKAVGHKVVRYGKKGQFDKFVETYLKKGMPVFAEGVTLKDFSRNEADGKDYLNVTIDTSMNDRGRIDPLKARMNMNRQVVSGFLADDSRIIDTKGGQMLTFRVVTTETFRSGNEMVERPVGHDVVQFGKKGQFDSLAALLKRGAGVYTEGQTEKRVSDKNGVKYLNVTVNATFQNIQITKYVTEKAQ